MSDHLCTGYDKIIRSLCKDCYLYCHSSYFGFLTRNHIEFTTQFLIAVPFAYFWLEPILDYKAIQTIPDVPFYLSAHGQSLGASSLSSALRYGYLKKQAQIRIES
jgi:hypothetical protein